MQLRDPSGTWLKDLQGALDQLWWTTRRASGANRRSWLATLYPAHVTFDWVASVYLFRPPTVAGGKFVYAADTPPRPQVGRSGSLRCPG